MELSQEMLAALAAADENYLIGLTNKGTVNRAKKDLSALKDVAAQSEKGYIRVTMGDVQCCIRTPIAGSECTCPSASLCRHRITAILWLRGNIESTPAKENTQEFNQLRNYPREKLMRELGNRRLSGILRRHGEGQGPKIEESSVVSVDLPWIPAAVRLLEPLEHSTCSCRSRTWCVHKSEALLYWQLNKGILNPADISVEEEKQWDMQLVREVSENVCSVVQSLMASGLNRMDPELRNSLERLEAQCKTARLPNLERRLRSLHGELNSYFFRSATFRDSALVKKLTRCYYLATQLRHATEENVAKLAGKFRDEYDAVGDLKLYMLAMRRIFGHGSYTGTVYYFRDREQNRYFTFRNMRPKTAAGTGRRPGDPSPWNLPCTLTQAWNQAIDLSGARTNRDGNLSSSEQTSALLKGKMSPWEVIPSSDIETDFLSLFQRICEEENSHEHLVLICPHECECLPFDQVRQVYSMILKDRSGCDIWLEVQYSREESYVVQLMENLERNLGAFAVPPVFFGYVYPEGDKLKFYPIEYFQNWREKP